MPRWKCWKCKVEADSKCIAQRNIFIAGMGVQMLASVLSIEVKPWAKNPKVDELRDVVFDITVACNSEEDKTEAATNAYKILREATEEDIRIVACQHEWELLSKECDFGCHVRKKIVQEGHHG